MAVEMPYRLPFSVDTWIGPSRRKPFHFLTHSHKDHTQGLESNARKPIYCSPMTLNIILKRHPKLDPSLFTTLCLNKGIMLGGDTDDPFTVTALDANHCPGATMLLFEGSWGNVLHTGDCRLTNDCLARIPRRWRNGTSTIDCLYLDCTFAREPQEMPSKQEAAHQVLRLIWDSSPKARIYFAMDMLGGEDLLRIVSSRTGLKFFLDSVAMPEFFSELMLAIPELLTEDSSSTRFHLCEGFPRLYDRAREKFAEADQTGKERPVFIRASAQWYTYHHRSEGAGSGVMMTEPASRGLKLQPSLWKDRDPAGKVLQGSGDSGQVAGSRYQRIVPAPTRAEQDEFGVWHVCYSMHSSRSELRAAIGVLQPKAVLSNTKLCSSSDVAHLVAGLGSGEVGICTKSLWEPSGPLVAAPCVAPSGLGGSTVKPEMAGLREADEGVSEEGQPKTTSIRCHISRTAPHMKYNVGARGAGLRIDTGKGTRDDLEADLDEDVNGSKDSAEGPAIDRAQGISGANKVNEVNRVNREGAAYHSCDPLEGEAASLTSSDFFATSPGNAGRSFRALRPPLPSSPPMLLPAESPSLSRVAFNVMVGARLFSSTVGCDGSPEEACDLSGSERDTREDSDYHAQELPGGYGRESTHANEAVPAPEEAPPVPSNGLQEAGVRLSSQKDSNDLATKHATAAACTISSSRSLSLSPTPVGPVLESGDLSLAAQDCEAGNPQGRCRNLNSWSGDGGAMEGAGHSFEFGSAGLGAGKGKAVGNLMRKSPQTDDAQRSSLVESKEALEGLQPSVCVCHHTKLNSSVHAEMSILSVAIGACPASEKGVGRKLPDGHCQNCKQDVIEMDSHKVLDRANTADEERGTKRCRESGESVRLGPQAEYGNVAVMYRYFHVAAPTPLRVCLLDLLTGDTNS